MTFTFKKIGILLLLFSIFISPNAFADDRGDLKDYMESLQNEVQAKYDTLVLRIEKMDSDDPKKDGVDSYTNSAKNAVRAFTSLDAGDNITANLQPSSIFEVKEKEARTKLNEASAYLIRPVMPGAKGVTKEGSVPTGDIIEDFIPQFIRLLFRFASLAILISFVVSGVMLITAFGNDERLSKAKTMLYYSLVGFAFVSLAFAIVKAVTDIDFFGFI